MEEIGELRIVSPSLSCYFVSICENSVTSQRERDVESPRELEEEGRICAAAHHR